MIAKLSGLLKNDYNRNVILNYLFKISGILLGLLNTRFTLSYLGTTVYGLWVTVTSVVTWMNSGDLGIGNGLRNELSRAYGEGDTKRQEQLIATAIGSLTKLSFVLMGVFLILCELLFYYGVLGYSLRIPMYITTIFFCINLILGVSQSIVFSYQKSWMNSFTTCGVQCFSIIAVFLLVHLGITADLTFFAFISGCCTTMPNLILIYILKKKNIHISIFKSRELYDKNIRKSIMNTGVQFFGIQICSVVLYSTDSVIINKIMNSEMVTKYAVITKVYDTGTNLYSILLIAFWSAVTYHIAQNNYQWIRLKLKQLLRIWLIFVFGVSIVSLFFNPIVKIWIGNGVDYYEPKLITLFALYCMITTFSSIFVNVLNGMGVIKLQLILALAEAVMNIPMSVFFARYCHMGISGVKLSTLICVIVTAIAMPIQAGIVLNKQRKNTD